MENVNAPLLISSESITDNISDMSEIFYQINHIASANTWYHRQLEEDSESLLSTIYGYSINSLCSNELSIHVNDMINIYLVNKTYILNGGCYTKTHLMITLNFDIFDELFALNNHNLKFIDLINVEKKKNSKEIKMLYMINFSTNNDILRFNLLNYEKNIYKYLKRIIWLDNEFVDIKIFDIYENDITSNILEYIKKESHDNLINNDSIIIPTTPVKKQKK